MIKQKIGKKPDEQPVICVLVVLGILSYTSAFIVIDLRDNLSLAFDVITIAGFICGFIALPLGLRLGNIELFPIRNPAHCPG